MPRSLRPFGLLGMTIALALALAGAGSAALAEDAPAPATPAGAAPAGGEVEPARFLDEHALATVLANDVPRSVRRFADSPYAALAATSWGRLAVGRLERALEPRGGSASMIAALLPTLERVALGIDAVPGSERPDIRLAVATGADVAPMQAICRNLVAGAHARGDADDAWWCDGSGTMTQAGRIFAFSNSAVFARDVQPSGDGGSPDPGSSHGSGSGVMAASARSARFPDACVEVAIDRGRLADALGIPALGGGPGAAALAVGLSLDPIGVREHWDLAVDPARLEHWRSLRQPPADRAVFDTLPPTTLLACAFTGDGAATVGALSCTGVLDDPMALLVVDVLLDRVGLPGMLELLGGLSGGTVAYLEDGAPCPWFTIAAGMQEPLARRILPILALGVGMTPLGDGKDEDTLNGFLGSSSFQAAYRDGHLILTTNPAGVAGYLARVGGFSALPEITAALAELPADAAFIGVSRSAQAAAALARLALIPAAHLGVPQLATLPNDLAARGRHGFIAVSATPSGLILDAGGILGGPLITYGVVGGGCYATYVAAMRRMQQQMQGARRHVDARLDPGRSM